MKRGVSSLGIPFAVGAWIVLASTIAGCGGTSVGGLGGVGGANAYVNSVDMCPNGGIATVSVNSQPLGTGLTFEQSSNYVPVASGTVPITFTLQADSSAAFATINPVLAAGNSYTSLVVGRADITSTTDARYPQVDLFTNTNAAPPVGDFGVRFIHAAPDIGNVDVEIGGQPFTTNLGYAKASSGPVTGGYTDFPSGPYSVVVNLTGTSTAAVPSSTITFLANQNYTIYLAEPTVSPSVTTALQLIDDTH